MYFVSLWVCLTGFKALAMLDAAKKISHNAPLISKQIWTSDLIYFLLPFLKAILLFHIHALPGFLIWDNYFNKILLTLDCFSPVQFNFRFNY